MIISANNKSLDLSKPHIMGVLNVTPDSFFDGGQFNSLDKALAQADKMIAAGASIIDIGGESTRPNASPVPVQEEINRVIPVVSAIRAKHSDVWLSVDTSNAQVMQLAIDTGIDMINDVRSLTQEGALEVAAKSGLPICIMHMQGQPSTMQNAPQYQNLILEVEEFFTQKINDCVTAGIARERLILDLGFGFGKTLEHNYELLANLDYFHKFNLPMLAGMSRKSMIFNLLEKSRHDPDVGYGSIVCATLALTKGASIIRAHDVVESIDMLKIFNKYNSYQK